MFLCLLFSRAGVRGDPARGRQDVGSRQERFSHRSLQRRHRRHAPVPLWRRKTRAANRVVERITHSYRSAIFPLTLILGQVRSVRVMSGQVRFCTKSANCWDRLG